MRRKSNSLLGLKAYWRVSLGFISDGLNTAEDAAPASSNCQGHDLDLFFRRNTLKLFKNNNNKSSNFNELKRILFSTQPVARDQFVVFFMKWELWLLWDSLSHRPGQGRFRSSVNLALLLQFVRRQVAYCT